MDTTAAFHKSVMDSLEKEKKRASNQQQQQLDNNGSATAKPNSDNNAATTASASPLIRRQSSSLLSRRGSSSSKSRDNDNNSNSKLSAKTPSWLQEQEEEDVTLLASQVMDASDHDDNTVMYSNTDNDAAAAVVNDAAAPRAAPRSSSLFGAVMQKIGSSIGSAMPSKSTTTTTTTTTNNNDPFESPQRRTKRPRSEGDGEKTTAAAAAAASSNGIGSGGGGSGSTTNFVQKFLGVPSPSGKTIMDILNNNFNSPFRFQSPQKKPKRQQRRSLQQQQQQPSSPSVAAAAKPNSQREASFSFSTPSPSKQLRRRLDSQGEHSNLSTSSSSNRFLFRDDEEAASRSRSMSITSNSIVAPPPEHNSNSNLSEASVGNWREIPIVVATQHNDGHNNGGDNTTTTTTTTTSSNTLDRMELLDWSLHSRWTLELHAPKDDDSSSNIRLEAVQQEVGWNDAIAYWEYRPRPPPLQDGVTEGIAWNSTTTTTNGKELLVRRGSIGASRGGATGSLMEWSKQQASKQASTNNAFKKKPNNNNTKELAKQLIQLVRGPDAKLSKKQQQQDPWQDNNDVSEPRLWQRAFRSLFQNFAARVHLLETNPKIVNPASFLLENYFYVVGMNHLVLFRIHEGGESSTLVPAVVVSRSSADFRDILQKQGVTSMEILETVEEQQTRENLSTVANSSKLFSKEKASNPLLSPSVTADLEALRQAQAFGESAGADVYVKIKKPRQASNLGRQHRNEAVRMTGWDDVQIFVEVYLNMLGDILPSTFLFDGALPMPTLMCHNDMGPFENASLKHLKVFPVQPETEENENDGQTTTVSLEICGPVLPSAARKVLVVGRRSLMNDDSNGSVKTNDDSPSADPSRYIVLEARRSAKAKRQRYDVAKDSLIFNQGKDKDGTSESVLECPVGKSLTMAVWDMSRQDVVACKLEDGYPML